jgi:hypothetical protein
MMNGTGRPGLDPQQKQTVFPLASVSRLTVTGANSLRTWRASKPTERQTDKQTTIQPPVQWVLGSFPGVSVTPTTQPPSSAEVKYESELRLLAPLAPAWR